MRNQDTCSLLSNPFDFSSCNYNDVNGSMSFYWSVYLNSYGD